MLEFDIRGDTSSMFEFDIAHCAVRGSGHANNDSTFDDGTIGKLNSGFGDQINGTIQYSRTGSGFGGDRMEDQDRGRRGWGP